MSLVEDYNGMIKPVVIRIAVDGETEEVKVVGVHDAKKIICVTMPPGIGLQEMRSAADDICNVLRSPGSYGLIMLEHGTKVQVIDI